MSYSNILDNYLSRYAIEENKNIVIALKGKSEEEYEHYKAIFNSSRSISRNNSKYNSYLLSSESHLTVSFASTLILEMLGYKNKACFFDTSQNNYYLDGSPVTK